MEIRLFGPMEVKIGGRPLPPLRSRKGMFALALLSLRHDRDVPRAYLAALLWPDSPEEQSLGSLRRTLTDLRQAMGEEYADCLRAPSARTLRLNPAHVSADVIAFDRDVQSAQTQTLERAVALYRGPLLEGCLEEWALQEREAREEAYLNALERLAALAKERGELAAAEGYLARAVRVRPWRETAQRERMEILAALGDYAAVTLAYRDLRERLRDALNADPDAQTTALYQRIRAEARRRAADVPAITSPSPPETAATDVRDDEPAAPPAPHNLKAPLTPLIGRHDERREILHGLQAGRLLCLTGTGGVGKTRLATDIAWSVRDDFPDGVRFADLSAISEAGMVTPTLAAAFDVREQVGETLREAVIERIGNRRILLIVDNCEHLLDESAEIIGDLLGRCHRLHVLATSRQALGLPGERLIILTPFPLPPASSGATLPVALLRRYDAVRLFVERASALTSFALDAENAADTLFICQALDGLPLALELAAAQVRALGVAEIARRLRKDFHFLMGSPRGLQPRQRTLNALLDWSYALLSPAEQTLFRRLAVFAGGATLEAAEQVAGRRSQVAVDNSPSSDPLRPATCDRRPDEILPLLAALVEKSLVFGEEGRGARRYRMLETVRQYGRTRLEAAGEAEEMAARHRDWYLQWAETARSHEDGPDRALWDARLENDRENLRLALRGSAEPETRLRLTVALSPFWLRRGNLSEGRAWLEGALTGIKKTANDALAASALHFAGIFAWMQGDFDAAQSHLERALVIAEARGETARMAALRNGRGIVSLERGDFGAALDDFRQSHALFAAAGDTRGLISVDINQGVALSALGQYEEAKALHRKALDAAETVGDERGVITSWGNLAEVAYAEGDYAAAGDFWVQCLQRDRELDYFWGIAASLANLGDVARQQGNRSGAITLYRDSLRRARQLEEKRLMAHALEGLAMAFALEQGDAPRNAVRFLSAAARLRRQMRMPLTLPYREETERTMTGLRLALGEAAFASAEEEGSRQNLDSLLDAALS